MEIEEGNLVVLIKLFVNLAQLIIGLIDKLKSSAAAEVKNEGIPHLTCLYLPTVPPQPLFVDRNIQEIEALIEKSDKYLPQNQRSSSRAEEEEDQQDHTNDSGPQGHCHSLLFFFAKSFVNWF